MRILVVSHKDGPNLFIENIVRRLHDRGHELAIYALFTDETSVRMFKDMDIPIRPFAELGKKTVETFDCKRNLC